MAFSDAVDQEDTVAKGHKQLASFMGVSKEEMPTIGALVYEDGIYPRKFTFQEDSELTSYENIRGFIESVLNELESQKTKKDEL